MNAWRKHPGWVPDAGAKNQRTPRPALPLQKNSGLATWYNGTRGVGECIARETPAKIVLDHMLQRRSAHTVASPPAAGKRHTRGLVGWQGGCYKS
jgi:hypothetical protein